MKVKFLLQYLPEWTIYCDMKHLHLMLNFGPGVWKFKITIGSWRLACIEIGPVCLRYLYI